MHSSRLPRVLHVVPSVGRQAGGLTTAVVGLAGALQDLGVETSVHATDAATPPQARKTRRGLVEADLPDRFSDIDITLYPMVEPYRLSFAPSMLGALARAARETDVVHIHGLFLFPHFAALRAAMQAEVPFIVSTHGMLSPHLQKRGRLRKRVVDIAFQQRMLRNAFVLHAVSDIERADLEALDFGPPVHVIPNGLDLASFVTDADGDRFRKAHGIAADTKIIASHGRINHVKGLDILIEALPRIQVNHPGTLVVIVGPDDEGLATTLKQKAADLGVAQSVLFVGGLDGKRLKDAIAAADVWTMLSRSDSFGLAVLEAMVLGRAIVASKYVGIAPEASRADALVMVDTEVVQAASAIDQLLQDEDERERLGEQARHFSQRFEWSNVASQFVDLYRNAIR